MSNTFGTILKLTSFGESHGFAIGGVIDGCPAGLPVDTEFIASELARRKPGMQDFATARKEDDRLEIISGVYEGISLGTPIAFLIKNKDTNPADYEGLKNVFRPSHADFTYYIKYGIRDHRGGGRSSARGTAVKVVGGAFAKMILRQENIQVNAYVTQIGNISVPESFSYSSSDVKADNALCCPHSETAVKMESFLAELKAKGDTTGGIISCIIKNVPAGIGEPVFGKLQAELAHAMLSINAAKGFEYGMGFQIASMLGSEVNDEFMFDKSSGKIKTKTNFSGGIQGGISNGEDIYFRVAFKPVPTIMQKQSTVDVDGKAIILEPRGRHDVCVVPRAVPVVEAMAALVIADNLLLSKVSRIKQ